MGHLEKLPPELFHLITLCLDIYDLYPLLVLFPTRGLYHQLRQGLYNQGHLVALLYAIHLGSLDIIQQIPNVPQLIRRFDDYARYVEHSDENAFFGGHDSMAQKFATINFRGYINPLIIAISERLNGRDDKIIRFLLENGAQLDVPDKFRRHFPLYVATDNTDLHVTNLLLEHQAPPNMTLGLHCRVPLDAAVERNDTGLVKLLLSHNGQLWSRPFHYPHLRRREKSCQSMRILNILLTSGAYDMSDEAILKVLRWRFSLPGRQSTRMRRSRRRRILTNNAAAALIGCMRSENFDTLWYEMLQLHSLS